MKGKTRCHAHGGKSRAPGPGHPTYIHGRRSKFTEHLPEHLRAGFEASMSDPDLLSVRVELGLIDTRLMELMSHLGTGESATRMGLLSEAVHHLGASIAGMGPVNKLSKSERALKRTLLEHMGRLRRLLDASLGDCRTWEDIYATVASRIKLTDTERKVVEMKRAHVDSDRLHVVLNQLLASVRTHVIKLPGGSEAVNGVATDLFKMLGLDVPTTAPEPEPEGRLN